MKKNTGYEIDFVNEQIIVTKAFLKAAGTLNTSEYTELQNIRRENPGFAIVQREISKKDSKKSYRNLTYKNMKDYIAAKEGENSPMLQQFEKVRSISKVQPGPYAYVKTWFLNLYGDAFKSEEEKEPAAPALHVVR